MAHGRETDRPIGGLTIAAPAPCRGNACPRRQQLAPVPAKISCGAPVRWSGPSQCPRYPGDWQQACRYQAGLRLCRPGTIGAPACEDQLDVPVRRSGLSQCPRCPGDWEQAVEIRRVGAGVAPGSLWEDARVPPTSSRLQQHPCASPAAAGDRSCPSCRPRAVGRHESPRTSLLPRRRTLARHRRDGGSGPGR